MPIKERAENMEKVAASVALPDFFNSSLGMKITADEVVQEVIAFMRADATRKYKVTIGTDSELLNTKNADFVTAIVVHRIGNGGRYFWRRFELGKFHTLRDRIIREVLISLEVAQDVLTELKKSDLPEFEFEIHADIGVNGPTNAVIQEVMGMIRAHNFEAKMKPESYAASNVADRHV
jgi:predicted RNase H-related nuclease YkuK (DUF458 family)